MSDTINLLFDASSDTIDLKFIAPYEVKLEVLEGFLLGADGADAVYSNENPLPAGTASPGTAEEASRSDHIHPAPNLSSVAFSGQYNDLSGKPLFGNAAFLSDAQLRDRSTHTGTQPASTVTGLATIATSGIYADLSGKPILGTSASRDVGVADGVAPLDSTGKLAPVFLPSYVDDVIEVPNFAALPPTGETGKIYVTLSPVPGLIYRWSGSTYTEISPSPGSTDAVPEGIGNLYHTAARVIALVTWDNLSSIPSWIASSVAFGQSLLAAADAVAARVLLGLGSAATQAAGAFAPSAHVGAGGTAHPDAVAAGASGFLSGADKSKIDGLAAVATSGAYADLTGTPITGDPTFIQATQPSGPSRFAWWDTSGGNLTLWIEDGT